MSALTKTERRVIDLLLAGDHRDLHTLRHQLDGARASSRSYTGAAFFTQISVDPSRAPLLPKRRILLSDVSAETNDHLLLGFILYVEAGLLDCLECHTWGLGEVDVEPLLTRLYYVAPRGQSLVAVSERDMDHLSNELSPKART